MRRQFAFILSFAVYFGVFATAFAQSNVCQSLRNKLASLPSSGGGLAQQQLSEIRKARSDLARLQCDSPSTANNPQRLNQCETISAALGSMESNYNRLSRSGGGDPYAKRRAQILSDIEVECARQQPQQNIFQNQSQAPRAESQLNTQQFQDNRRQPAPNAAGESQSSEAGFLSWLFGRINPRQNNQQQIAPNQFQAPNLDPNAPPQIGGSLRTLCVRTCDGYYWPISYSSSPSRADRDESICEQMCPAQTTQLFYHYTQGQWSENMVNAEGTPYKSMSYAFAYREKYNPDCACRVLKQPEGAEPLNKPKESAAGTTKLEFPLAIQPAKSIEKPFEPNASVVKPNTENVLKPLEQNQQNPFLPEPSTPHSENILRTPDNLGISLQSGGSSVKYNDGALIKVPKSP